MSAEESGPAKEEESKVPPAPVKFEISTGLIIAAGYANKLRRVALVSLSKTVPKDIIIRDISEINKKLFEELITTNKIDKLDVIRLNVSLEYDPSANKINLKEYRLIRYIPEEKCKGASQEEINAIKAENEKLKAEISDLKNKLNEILKSINKS